MGVFIFKNKTTQLFLWLLDFCLSVLRFVKSLSHVRLLLSFQLFQYYFNLWSGCLNFTVLINNSLHLKNLWEKKKNLRERWQTYHENIILQRTRLWYMVSKWIKMEKVELFSDLMDDVVISHVLSNNKLIKLTLRNVQLQNSLFLL